MVGTSNAKVASVGADIFLPICDRAHSINGRRLPEQKLFASLSIATLYRLAHVISLYVSRNEDYSL